MSVAKKPGKVGASADGKWVVKDGSRSATHPDKAAPRRPLAAHPLEVSEAELERVIDDVMEKTSAARDILGK
jgi:hypothetical protein